MSNLSPNSFLAFFISLIITLNSLKALETEDEIKVISSKLIKNQLSGGTTHIITRENIQNYSEETLPQMMLPDICIDIFAHDTRSFLRNGLQFRHS